MPTIGKFTCFPTQGYWNPLKKNFKVDLIKKLFFFLDVDEHQCTRIDVLSILPFSVKPMGVDILECVRRFSSDQNEVGTDLWTKLVYV